MIVLGDFMAYQIIYHKDKYRNRSTPFRLYSLILLFFVLFLYYVWRIWPDGAEFLHRRFIFHNFPGGISGLNVLAEKLRNAEEPLAAFSAFYAIMMP